MSNWAEMIRQQMIQGTAQAQPPGPAGPPPGVVPPAPPLDAGMPASPPAGPSTAPSVPKLSTNNTSRGEGIGSSFMQGVTWNFWDEMMGVGAALVPGGLGYKQARDKERRKYRREQEANPTASFVAEMGGAAMSGFGLAGVGRAAATKLAARGASKLASATSAATGTAEFLGKGKGYLSTAKRAGTTGALQGAVVGVGQAEETNDMLGAAAGSAAFGAAGGAALGAATRGVANWWKARAGDPGSAARHKEITSGALGETYKDVQRRLIAELGLPAGTDWDGLAVALNQRADLLAGNEAVKTGAQQVAQMAKVPVHALTDTTHRAMRAALTAKALGSNTAAADAAQTAFEQSEDVFSTAGRRALQLVGYGQEASKGLRKRKGMSLLRVADGIDLRQFGTQGGKAQTLEFADVSSVMNNTRDVVVKGFDALLDPAVTGNLLADVAQNAPTGAAVVGRLQAARDKLSVMVPRAQSAAEMPTMLKDMKDQLGESVYEGLDNAVFTYKGLESAMGEKAAENWTVELLNGRLDDFIQDGAEARLAREALQVGAVDDQGMFMGWADMPDNLKRLVNRTWQMKLMADEMGGGVSDADIGKLYNGVVDRKFRATRNVRRGRGQDMSRMEFLAGVDNVKTWDKARRELNALFGSQAAGSEKRYDTGGMISGLNRWATGGRQGMYKRAMSSSVNDAPAGEEALWLGANKMYGMLEDVSQAYRLGYTRRSPRGSEGLGGEALRDELDELVRRAGRTVTRRQKADTQLDTRRANAELLAMRAGVLAHMTDNIRQMQPATSGGLAAGPDQAKFLSQMALMGDDLDLLSRSARRGKVKEDAESWVNIVDEWKRAHENVVKGMNQLMTQRDLPPSTRRSAAELYRNAQAEFGQMVFDASHGYIQFYMVGKMVDMLTQARQMRRAETRGNLVFEAMQSGIAGFVREAKEAIEAGTLVGVDSTMGSMMASGVNPTLVGLNAGLGEQASRESGFDKRVRELAGPGPQGDR